MLLIFPQSPEQVSWQKYHKVPLGRRVEGSQGPVEWVLVKAAHVGVHFTWLFG